MKPGSLAAAALLLLSLSGPTHAQDPPPLVGKPAPAFGLPTLDGGHVDLADQRGRIVVLHFGTGW